VTILRSRVAVCVAVCIAVCGVVCVAVCCSVIVLRARVNTKVSGCSVLQ